MLVTALAHSLAFNAPSFACLAAQGREEDDESSCITLAFVWQDEVYISSTILSSQLPPLAALP